MVIDDDDDDDDLFFIVHSGLFVCLFVCDLQIRRSSSKNVCVRWSSPESFPALALLLLITPLLSLLFHYFIIVVMFFTVSLIFLFFTFLMFAITTSSTTALGNFVAVFFISSALWLCTFGNQELNCRFQNQKI